MQEITDIAELHRIELGIMKAVRDFCDTHDIRYFLCGGTLLGAIRHKGFIPWDDDADIGMLRPDLVRFCKEFESDRYAIVSPETDSRFNYLFPKVVDTWTTLLEQGCASRKLGAYVDLCPFDGAPNANYYPRRDFRPWETILRALNQRNAPVFSRRNTVSTQFTLLLGAPFRLVPNWWITRFLTRLASNHSTDTAPFIGGLVMGYGPREVLPRSVFDGDVRVKFEGEPFKAMSGWDRYLSALYGDYMTPPPPDKRKTAHHFQVWWKDGFPRA